MVSISSFYNCIWLILNDAIVGIAFGAFLCENSDILASLMHSYGKVCHVRSVFDTFKLFLIQKFETWTVDRIQHSLVWLDNWPVGLKLNTQLSHFYCLCLMGLVDFWAGIYIGF